MPIDIIEMLWGCLVCDSENKGRFKVCQNCGKPRTKKSPEWMPEDISPMAAVKDSKLLSKFVGGRDWHCKYCDSSQYRVDGSCVQCGSDQKKSEEVKITISDDPELLEQRILKANISIPISLLPKSTNLNSQRKIDKKIGLGIFLFILLGLVLYFVFRTKIVEATVSSIEWQRTISVERYQILDKDGWSPDFESFDIRDEGKRIHHYEHVHIGSHIESFQENYQCGENCTTIPGNCYTTPRICTSNGNGSATCSGGDRMCSPDTQSCSPQYCTRLNQRTVEDYEDQPNYRTWYSWKVWDWATIEMLHHQDQMNRSIGHPKNSFILESI